ncbi:hypothetical protein WJX72_011023 [[Myrmecia] bisecta]|uniref:Uncharacterized protein n=1 Tax=[Myrmecia] bisecta TaxID=41462 RepID=A0AAW1P929_9CHLO
MSSCSSSSFFQWTSAVTGTALHGPAFPKPRWMPHRSSQAFEAECGTNCAIISVMPHTHAPWSEALQQTAVRTPAGYGLTLLHHQPTVRLLMDIGGAQLIETVLRTTFRQHDAWHPSDASNDVHMKVNAGELAASLCMYMDPAANPTATMSVLATVCKVLAVQDTSNPAAAHQGQAVAECCLTCVEALIAAWSEQPKLSRPDGSTLGEFKLLRPHCAATSSSSIVSKREALFAHTAAWALPVLLTRGPEGERLKHWLAILARLVAFLHPTAAITDAVALHMFSGFAAVFQSRLHSARPDAPSISAALCMMCMAINLISAHPGGDRRLHCAALVQTGLLGCISRLACRWWADEGWFFAHGLLIKRLLPAMCAILPADAASSSRLRAADACFADADIDTDFLPGLAPVKHQPAPFLRNMFHSVEFVKHSPERALRLVSGLSQTTKQMAVNNITVLVEALEAKYSAWDARCAAMELERSRMAALGPGCNSPACRNLAGKQGIANH